MKKKAVILLSGGPDSATVLAHMIKENYESYPISFDYGQSHTIELQYINKILANFNINNHKLVKIDLRSIGGSALTGGFEVPKNSLEPSIIPVTYVPVRNLIFLSLATAYAETLGIYDIFIGANVIDYSQYPDCRPEFLESFANTATLASKAGTEGHKFKIHAPLIKLTKGEIITLGAKLGVNFANTISCYDPSSEGESCGECNSCLIRLKGFKDANLTDPVAYKKFEPARS